MMYLSESIDSAEMVGFLPQVCRMTDRLQRFGCARCGFEDGKDVSRP